jgi:hypothetical protein
MAQAWDNFSIKPPDFKTFPQLLKACATIVIDGIRDDILFEIKPDGSPQKQNSPDYADRKWDAKGYTTPLMGMKPESPYLATRKAWKHEMIDELTVAITLGSKRAKVRQPLEDKGYEFFDFPKGIMPKVWKRIDQWCKNEIRKMRFGKS